MSIRVMSFNIRYGSANDGKNHWNKRKSLVIDRIQNFSPELLGLQECRDDAQAEFIKTSLPEYHFYGVRREVDGDADLEMASILYKKDTFILRKNGCFWLSDTPRISGSKSWDSVFPRVAVWVELIHLPSSRLIYYINTHFDYKPVSIEKSSRLLAKWIDLVVRQQPLIVTGDFNASKNSNAYQRLTNKGILYDVFKKVHPQALYEGTFNNFGQSGQEVAIDWILVSDHFEVIAADVDRYHEERLYPSDHFPVTAELLLN